MSTPFQKAFPGADENTVFEVIRTTLRFSAGDLIKIVKDDGSHCPLFSLTKGGTPYYIWLDQIRIKEPQLKKGDRCLVSSNGKDWKERKYYCDISDSGSSRPNLCFRSIGGGVMGWKYAKPLPQTQTVTLQDGTELTIPNDAAEKLREEYA